MRKLFTSLAICLTVAVSSLSGQVKNAGCYLRMVTPANDELCLENEQVRIDFEFNSANYFVDVTIRNKTDGVLTVDWDKFTVVIEEEADGIVFDDTVMLAKDAPKGAATLVPGSKVTKAVASKEHIELDMAYYTKGWVKKRGTQIIGFLIPVTNEAGETTNYRCEISVSLQ